MTLIESIQFLEANLTMMKFNGVSAEMKNFYDAMNNVVSFSKQQYAKEVAANVVGKVAELAAGTKEDSEEGGE